jgi:multidrug efflux pump subunit AcrA (membrane-fusion protein)
MDIARDTSRARRRRFVIGIAAACALLLFTLGLRRIRPAAPVVDRATVWIDVAKKGDMLREVRGAGMLTPEVFRWIPAAAEGRVERILLYPGTTVKADSVILELSNPEVLLASEDAELQLRSAEADLVTRKVRVEGEKLDQEARLASLEFEYNQATRERDMNDRLVKDGLVSSLALENSRGRVTELEKRLAIERRRLTMTDETIRAELASQRTNVEKSLALSSVRRGQAAALRVGAGIDGVLEQINVEVGQRVTPGTTLAKVARPDKLKAELKITETQARDIQVGQPAEIDTRNGTVQGLVSRIDPAVQNGTVTVEVALRGALPKGVRPDLSVEGAIQLERLSNVLSIGRPALGAEHSVLGLFVLEPGGHYARRVRVQLGRRSVNAVEILEGLKAGDQAILSDMSRWDGFDRIRLE